MALAERCKLCLKCERTSGKWHEVKDPSPNDSKRRPKHCALLGYDEPGARSQRQQRKTTVAVSSTCVFQRRRYNTFTQRGIIHITDC